MARRQQPKRLIDTAEAVIYTPRPGHWKGRERASSVDWLIHHAGLVIRVEHITSGYGPAWRCVIATLADGRQWIAHMPNADALLFIGTCFPGKVMEG